MRLHYSITDYGCPCELLGVHRPVRTKCNVSVQIDYFYQDSFPFWIDVYVGANHSSVTSAPETSCI